MLTQQTLKQSYRYDENTGNFFSIRDNRKIGHVNPQGYVRISIFGKPYLAHRMAWFYVYGEFVDVIDHIDGDPSNNMISNLRSVSRSENQQNRNLNRTWSKSGRMGVYWEKRKNRWRAQIVINGKKKHLGLHIDIESAAAAYINARKEAKSLFTYTEKKLSGKTSSELKSAIRLIKSGYSVSDACSKYGISRSTVYRSKLYKDLISKKALAKAEKEQANG